MGHEVIERIINHMEIYNKILRNSGNPKLDGRIQKKINLTLLYSQCCGLTTRKTSG